MLWDSRVGTRGPPGHVLEPVMTIQVPLYWLPSLPHPSAPWQLSSCSMLHYSWSWPCFGIATGEHISMQDEAGQITIDAFEWKMVLMAREAQGGLSCPSLQYKSRLFAPPRWVPAGHGNAMMACKQVPSIFG